MITNENDFIGIMMKCKNEQDICDVMKVIELSGMSDMQCLPFIQSLSSKGIIRSIDTQYIQILSPIPFMKARRRKQENHSLNFPYRF